MEPNITTPKCVEQNVESNVRKRGQSMSAGANEQSRVSSGAHSKQSIWFQAVMVHVAVSCY